MKIKVFLEICSVSIFIFLLVIALPAWAVKPRPPLQLSLQQSSVSERENRLTMVAKANVDIRDAVLSLELPSGLRLIQGAEDGWEGSLKKGEMQQLDWTVRSGDTLPRQVVGKAVIRLNTGEEFTERSVLTLHEEKKDEKKEEDKDERTRSPSVKRKQGGENILEFKGK
ncbi:MAG: hypothetical protein HY282_19215 [Nitrospirae bacterium]|nr:hypothetical protein [Candidatus Manganitrophaceae bacterium]